MSETLTLPVLPLDDQVVLPGMVIPLETSQAEVSAAIDAARMPSRQVPGVRSEAGARVLLVPRLHGRGPRADELAQQYKTLVTGILQQRGAWQVIDAIQQITDASAVADNAGYASDLTTAQKLQLLETSDLVERLELVIGWTKEHLAELDVAESIRKDV